MTASDAPPSAAERDLRLSCLDHFTVPVRDFGIATRFYTDVLGGAVTQEPDWAPFERGWSRGAHMAIQLFREEGHLVLYWQSWGQPSPDQMHPYRAFTVDSPQGMDEIARRLQQAAVPCVVATPTAAEAGAPVRASLHFRDPDGDQVAVVCERYPFHPGMHVGPLDPTALHYRWERASAGPAPPLRGRVGAGGHKFLRSRTRPTPRERQARPGHKYGAAPADLPLTAVDRFTLPVRELEKAELFYRQVLGAEPLESDTLEVDGSAAIRLQACPGVQVSLAEQNHGWQPIDTSNPHWAFEIPGAEAEEWVRHLAAWGVPSALVFRDDYVVDPGVPTRVELHFLDPDGNQIELVAWDYPMNDRAFRGHYNPWELAYRYDRWPPRL